MKIFFSIIVLLVSFACQGGSYNWYSGTLEQAKEIAGSKLIMMKFYTYT